MVGIITSTMDLSMVLSDKMRSRFQFYEIRLDSDKWRNDGEISMAIMGLGMINPRPMIILTCRSRKDGGFQTISYQKRLAKITYYANKHRDVIWGLDIEGRYVFTRHKVAQKIYSTLNGSNLHEDGLDIRCNLGVSVVPLQSTENQPKKLEMILSAHYPDRIVEEMTRHINHIGQASDAGAYVMKIAFRITSEADYVSLYKMIKRDLPALITGSGRKNIHSRKIHITLLGVGDPSLGNDEAVRLSVEARKYFARRGLCFLLYVTVGDTHIPGIPHVKDMMKS